MNADDKLGINLAFRKSLLKTMRPEFDAALKDIYSVMYTIFEAATKPEELSALVEALKPFDSTVRSSKSVTAYVENKGDHEPKLCYFGPSSADYDDFSNKRIVTHCSEGLFDSLKFERIPFISPGMYRSSDNHAAVNKRVIKEHHHKQYKATVNVWKDLVKKFDSALETAETIINKHYSAKSLVKTWPEIEELVPDYLLEKGGRGLMVVPTELNQLAGIGVKDATPTSK